MNKEEWERRVKSLLIDITCDSRVKDKLFLGADRKTTYGVEAKELLDGLR